MSLAAASKHIKALEGAGLVRREVQGRTHVCRLDAGPLLAADEWLRYYERFWNERLDQLEALLRLDSASTPASAAAPPSRPAPRGALVKTATPRKRRTR